MTAVVGDAVGGTSAARLDSGDDAVDAGTFGGEIDDGSGEPQPAMTRMVIAAARNVEPLCRTAWIIVSPAYLD